MKVLAAVIVYNRIHTLANWVRAWSIADHTGAQLVFVHSTGAVPNRVVADLASTADALYRPRPNEGMDIGALREVIALRTADPAVATVEDQAYRDWDVLYWSTDDALPMRPDFLRLFVKRFGDHDVGLVSNYILPADTYETVPEHARTVAFAIRSEVAARLQFPHPILSKGDCWRFEWGAYNMHRQVQNMGYRSVPVDPSAWPEGAKPWYMCNDIIWDCGEINTGILWDWRRQQDHTWQFEDQFNRRAAGVQHERGPVHSLPEA